MTMTATATRAFRKVGLGVRLVATLASALVLAWACGGSSSLQGVALASNTDKAPITWWIPGPSPTPGVLQAAAKRFTQKTGIQVEIDQVPTATYFTKQTTAIASGTLPDVLMTGNTNSATLAATGAFVSWTKKQFKTIGGESQFLSNSMATAGIPGQPPMSIPFLAQTWVLLYNKDLFKQAGISSPPLTWSSFVTDAEKLSDPSANKYGVAVDLGSPSSESTWSWIMSQQYGGTFFNKSGKADVTSSQNATAITSYLKWIYPDQIVSPADATDTTGTTAQTEFQTGVAAMTLTQNIKPVINDPSEFGLSYIPLPSPMPKGGKKVMSHVAGWNLAIPKNTKHLSEAEEFIKFLINPAEQIRINKGYYLLPTTKTAIKQSYFQTAEMKKFAGILDTYAQPIPGYADSATTVHDMGNAIVSLVRTDISQKNITQSQVATALQEAQKTIVATGD